MLPPGVTISAEGAPAAPAAWHGAGRGGISSASRLGGVTCSSSAKRGANKRNRRHLPRPTSARRQHEGWPRRRPRRARRGPAAINRRRLGVLKIDQCLRAGGRRRAEMISAPREAALSRHGGGNRAISSSARHQICLSMPAALASAQGGFLAALDRVSALAHRRALLSTRRREIGSAAAWHRPRSRVARRDFAVNGSRAWPASISIGGRPISGGSIRWPRAGRPKY